MAMGVRSISRTGPRLFWTIWSSAFCIFLAIGSTARSEDPGPARLRARTVPVIRKIDIRIHDIFEGDNLEAVYRTANALKVATRRSVIGRELLFKEGEPLNQFLLDESARNLREFGFIREVQIRAKVDGDFADIVVDVEDVWTLTPQIGFSSGGGVTKRSIGLAESNVLGFGKRAEAFVAEKDNRHIVQALYDDPRLLGTFQRLFLGQFQRSDGYQTIGLYGRPYNALEDRDAWATYTDISDTVGALYEYGNESYIWRQRHQEAGLYYSLASGDPEWSRHRFYAGYSYLADQFKQATDRDFDDIGLTPGSLPTDPALLPDDRRLTGPYLEYEFINPDYISMNYIDRFERVEDFNLGTELTVKSVFAPEFLGSIGNNVVLLIDLRRGCRLSDRTFLRGELGGSTQMDSDGFLNTFLRSEFKFFSARGPQFAGPLYLGRHTLAAAGFFDFGDRLDKDRQLVLGADNGLRGYLTRMFTGDKRVLLSVEDRTHLFEDVFHFLGIGTAVFGDIGGASYDALGTLLTSQMYSDLGVGLRIGFPRATNSGVVRIDLAFPLRNSPDGDHEAWKPVLFVSTGQAFDGLLRAEREGVENANISVGQDR